MACPGCANGIRNLFLHSDIQFAEFLKLKEWAFKDKVLKYVRLYAASRVTAHACICTHVPKQQQSRTPGIAITSTRSHVRYPGSVDVTGPQSAGLCWVVPLEGQEGLGGWSSRKARKTRTRDKAHRDIRWRI